MLYMKCMIISQIKPKNYLKKILKNCIIETIKVRDQTQKNLNLTLNKMQNRISVKKNNYLRVKTLSKIQISK